MSATVLGRLDWSASRNEDGHREYKLKTLVECTSSSDGPVVVMNATGLPRIGSSWSFGNDFDSWAYCKPNITVTPRISDEPNFYWEVEQTFSTVPIQRCQDTSIDNPLQEPARVSGSFTKYTKETTVDASGDPIQSSSHEIIHGIERDYHRPTVEIEQNVASLGLSTFTSMINTLNDAPLWGLAARRIKLSNISWSRNLYGTCAFYYTRRLSFEIRFEGFDRTDIVDKGYMKLKSGGDKTDPADFVRIKDDNGDAKPKETLLDGNGNPLAKGATPVTIGTVQLYSSSNFFLLGIPSVL